MIVEDEQDRYDVSQFQQVEGNGTTNVDFTYSKNIPTNLDNIVDNRIQLREIYTNN